MWGYIYDHNNVHNQLAAQQIYFPPKAAFATAKAGTEITPRDDSLPGEVFRSTAAHRPAGRGLR